VVAGGPLRTLFAIVLMPTVAATLLWCELGILKRRSHRRTHAPAPEHGVIFVMASGAVRVVSALGERLVAAVSREQQADDKDASEQFSQVLSSEAEMSQDEEKLIRGAIALPRISVREVMVPRLGVVAVDIDTPWSEMLDRVRSSEHSRLPAYSESLDDVIGLLVAKDLLPFALEERVPEGGWQQLLRPVSFVPATKAVADQLREFRDSRTHMAIVVDEFGGTAGILTIEDALEELVGEIRDEHDVEEPPITSEDNQRFWVSGRVPIDTLEELLEDSLDHGLTSTVGGLVFERFGRIPTVGEEIQWGRYRVVVERMERHAVARVYIERLPPGDD
jgi:CBS domain containing-hemolysin-like protein